MVPVNKRTMKSSTVLPSCFSLALFSFQQPLFGGHVSRNVVVSFQVIFEMLILPPSIFFSLHIPVSVIFSKSPAKFLQRLSKQGKILFLRFKLLHDTDLPYQYLASIFSTVLHIRGMLTAALCPGHCLSVCQFSFLSTDLKPTQDFRSNPTLIFHKLFLLQQFQPLECSQDSSVVLDVVQYMVAGSLHRDWT